MVNSDEGNMGSKVFFVWGALCCGCFFWAYFLVYETKGMFSHLLRAYIDHLYFKTNYFCPGLSLEQVDKLLVETTPRTSSKWVPTTTFASEMGINEKGGLNSNVIEDVQRRGSAV
jgi:SP family sugar:H+ symporter-like MFS transporter